MCDDQNLKENLEPWTILHYLVIEVLKPIFIEIEGFIEDFYDAQQITLQSIIDEIGKEDVKEIWKICDIRFGKKDHMHYIVISNEISFLCTCLTTISRGIICRYYFRVMMFSKVAGFDISMIPERWYQDVYQ
ncbi:unnamed protein product [Rhizophagus irregularis]|nr:unnamed protein product [Rhizophagus irregularis]CAB5185123.1 unnamed protein product [Rhizophagus irregularis]